jgi:hypothetical protein
MACEGHARCPRNGPQAGCCPCSPARLTSYPCPLPAPLQAGRLAAEPDARAGGWLLAASMSKPAAGAAGATPASSSAAAPPAEPTAGAQQPQAQEQREQQAAGAAPAPPGPAQLARLAAAASSMSASELADLVRALANSGCDDPLAWWQAIGAAKQQVRRCSRAARMLGCSPFGNCFPGC